MTSHPLHADARAHFMSTMGLEHDVNDETAWGRVTVGPYLQTGAGWPSVAALLTFADVLVGRLASERTAPRISVTANLGVRMVAPLPDDGRLELQASLAKTGRTMTVGETTFLAAGTGEVVATSIGTFLASPRPQDVALDGLRAGPLDAPGPVASTLAAQVGLDVVSPGVATVALRPELLNATESLQGGVVALLGELGAQSAASAATGRSHVVDSLDVYYLAAARVGPFVTSTSLFAVEPARTLARVEARDPGRDDRVVSITVAGTRALD